MAERFHRVKNKKTGVESVVVERYLECYCLYLKDWRNGDKLLRAKSLSNDDYEYMEPVKMGTSKKN